MRVVLVINGIYSGGGGRVMTWLARELAQRGHDVVLAVQAKPSTDFYQVDPRVVVVRCGSLPSRLRRFSVVADGAVAWSVRRIVRRHRAEVVVSFIRQINLAVLMGLIGTGVPVVVSERSHPFAYADLGRWRRRLRPRLYRRAAGVVVLSDEIAGQARRTWRLGKVDVIANPAHPVARVTALAERDRVVVCVGRLNELKGHPSLIEAWARSSAPARGWTLRLVGDGSMRSDVTALADRLGVAGSVEMPGSTHDVEAEYLRAAVFVLPSVVEGFPNALLEAMACGCACIATDCPGATGDILARGDAGVLVPVGDPAALGAALDRLTADDPTERLRLAAAALARSRDFSPDDVAGQWLDVITTAAAR
jgi:GalNAc-alpha-(1->4)-GalNAc-alpha-(1->3)-diNAcBac-PP-undecaprenol alpha-1,4-N-acetyl-D-galactosaminyltransferase